MPEMFWKMSIKSLRMERRCIRCPGAFEFECTVAEPFEIAGLSYAGAVLGLGSEPRVPILCRGVDGMAQIHFCDFSFMTANARKFSSILNASSQPRASLTRSPRRNPWLSNISSCLSNQSINPAASNSGCG